MGLMTRVEFLEVERNVLEKNIVVVRKDPKEVEESVRIIREQRK